MTEIAVAGRSTVAREMNCRHKAWTSRFTPTAPSSQNKAWRPRKVNRQATRGWIAAKDNMLRVSTCYKGLVFFQQDPTAAAWAPTKWRTWPHITLPSDRDAPAVCGSFCVAYDKRMRINTTQWWDESHDMENDLFNTYKDMGNYAFVLTMCVALNLKHGSERDRDLRYYQMREVLDQIYKVFEPHTCASFACRSADMYKEMEHEIEHDASVSPEISLWNHIKKRKSLLNERVNLVRFLKWLAASIDMLGEWTLTSWQLEALCLESDWVGSGAMTKKIELKKATIAETEALNSTSSSIPSIDGKIF